MTRLKLMLKLRTAFQATSLLQSGVSAAAVNMADSGAVCMEAYAPACYLPGRIARERQPITSDMTDMSALMCPP